MRRDKQAKFKQAEGIIDQLKIDILKMIGEDRIPEEWDGYEMRRLIRDYYEANCLMPFPSKEREKKYKRECLVRNLF